jgi:hypothetical protein
MMCCKRAAMPSKNLGGNARRSRGRGRRYNVVQVAVVLLDGKIDVNAGFFAIIDAIRMITMECKSGNGASRY